MTAPAAPQRRLRLQPSRKRRAAPVVEATSAIAEAPALAPIPPLALRLAAVLLECPPDDEYKLFLLRKQLLRSLAIHYRVLEVRRA